MYVIDAIPNDVYGDRPQIPIADGNHEKIGEMAANFFIKRGFRNFAWCGIDGLTFSDRRGDAFCREIAARGFESLRYRRPRRIRADSSLFYDERLDRIPDAAELARWLGSVPKPTAVFCCHDYRAYQLMLVASDLKIHIPEELSILAHLTRLRMMVKEIALLCGYRSVQYFCRAFAAFHGRQPLSVRESARQNADVST